MKALTGQRIKPARLQTFAELRKSGKTLAYVAEALKISERTAKRWEQLRLKALSMEQGT